MKRVYSAETLFQVAHMQNLLATYGITAQLRNANLAGGLGELPMMETWPSLWVDETAFEAASRLVDQELHAPPRGEPWTCASCGERIEGQFTQCWHCGNAAPAAGA